MTNSKRFTDDESDETVDESAGANVPEPVSSLDHVGRGVIGSNSLIPSQSFWPFAARKPQHRTPKR